MVIYHHNLMRDGTQFQRQVQMFHGRGNAACFIHRRDDDTQQGQWFRGCLSCIHERLRANSEGSTCSPPVPVSRLLRCLVFDDSEADR